MQHPEEGIIHAWLDGELPAEEAAALEAHVVACADCSAKVAEARGLVAASSRIVSALDIVPGGVIPAAKHARRPWYASTQLRAAAAVLIVAGASALVMRNGGKRAMEDSITVSAPLPQERAPAAPPPTSLPSIAAAPMTKEPARDEGRTAGPSAASSSRQSLKLEDSQSAKKTDRAEDARAEKAFSPPPPRESGNALAGSVSGVAVQIAPAPVAAPAPSIAMLSMAAPEFKKVRSDSTGTVARTIFRTSDSLDVTLTDIAPLPQVNARRVQQSKVLDAPASIVVTGTAASIPKPKAEPQGEIFTITWTDKRGHAMTLRGPVPLTVLEQIRRTLPEDQR